MFFLALSSSIDSLGIGITYGIRNTKISNLAKLILFFISFTISFLAISFGNLLKDFLPYTFTCILGSILLVFLGGFVCFQAIYGKSKDKELKCNEVFSEAKIYRFFIKFLGITIQIIKDPISSDFDNSNLIDGKEAIFLGVALSIDSLAIGISSGILGFSSIAFSVLVAIFQLIFLSFGNKIGCSLNKASHLPNCIWSILSGILLIFIGLFKLFF